MLGTIYDCKYKYFLVGRALFFWQSDEEVSLRDACLICAEDMCSTAFTPQVLSSSYSGQALYVA